VLDAWQPACCTDGGGGSRSIGYFVRKGTESLIVFCSYICVQEKPFPTYELRETEEVFETEGEVTYAETAQPDHAPDYTPNYAGGGNDAETGRLDDRAPLHHGAWSVKP
jgi:hypothetical protein